MAVQTDVCQPRYAAIVLKAHVSRAGTLISRRKLREVCAVTAECEPSLNQWRQCLSYGRYFRRSEGLVSGVLSV